MKSIRLGQEPAFFVLREYLDYSSSKNTSSDVHFFCSNGIVYAHKLVLASVSSLWREILLESNQDKIISVILPDLTVGAVSEYVDAVYRGRNNELFSDVIFHPKAENVETVEKKMRNQSKMQVEDNMKQKAKVSDDSLTDSLTEIVDDMDQDGFDEGSMMEDIETYGIVPDDDTRPNRKDDPFDKNRDLEYTEENVNEVSTDCHDETFVDIDESILQEISRERIMEDKEMLGTIPDYDSVKESQFTKQKCKRKTSKIWKHFSENEKVVRFRGTSIDNLHECNYCGKPIKKSLGNLSPLWNHFLKFHSDKNIDDDKPMKFNGDIENEGKKQDLDNIHEIKILRKIWMHFTTEDSNDESTVNYKCKYCDQLYNSNTSLVSDLWNHVSNDHQEQLTRGRKYNSFVWKHYKRTWREDGTSVGECRYCRRDFKHKNGNTTGLRHHLYSLHKDMLSKDDILSFKQN